MSTTPVLLAIESSCDETSAAVLRGRSVLSNVIASQKIHEKYGGVVPELASRAHQSNIVPVVEQALREASISLQDISGIAFTQGPGLMGSLHVGCSFAKSLSLALGVPLIAVQHMQAHVLAHFIENEQGMYPEFPFICLTISGGHTQLVYVRSPLHMEIIGETLDDAAGEAFDKAAKLLGLSYPGGPEVDKLAKLGDPQRFQFPHPKVPGLDYSFSGLKTSLLYLVRDELAKNKDFIENHRNDICASFQKAVVQYTLQGLTLALKQFKVKDLSLAGGVSANSAMRAHFRELCDRFEVNAFIPPMAYCTDNAAMIGIVGYYKYQQGLFADLSSSPKARMAWDKN